MRPDRTADRFGLRLGIFYACLFGILGIQLPFLPLWLQARGLDEEAIGIVLAVPIVMRIVAVPLLSRAVDRRGDLRQGLIAASFAGVVGFAAVGSAYGFIPILLAVALASFLSSPLTSLADAYALRGLAARGQAYGPVRLWGSAAFIAANIGTGLLLAVVAANELIWLIVAAFALLGMASLLLRPLAPPSGQEAVRADAHLWGSHKFLLIAAAASLIQASHALYYGFSAVDWTAKGVATTTVGLLWGLGVAAEIVLFAVSGRVPFSPVAWLALGALGAAIRWSAMAFNPPAALLPLLQCLHALSFGATHLGSVQFVARTAGGGRAAAAQGDFATILAIGSAAATALAGLLYAAWGDKAYVAMAGSAVLGGLCLLPVRRPKK
jgi:PPP family 3-phenylpropionic acid transporter